ncbi:hypothetical protein HDU80_009083 [Chytriomyces hyalinus]|nr:hypothetical protein HDU80_009083 [Chytriomyces hyalinus]
MAVTLETFGSELYGKPNYPSHPHQKYAPLEDYKYVDVALHAGKDKESLLSIPAAQFTDL